MKKPSANWIPSLKLGWDAEIPKSERYHHADQRKIDSEANYNDAEDCTESIEDEVDLNTEYNYTMSWWMLLVRQMIAYGC